VFAVGGIPRSTHGGKTWHPTIDINSDVHEIYADRTNPEIVVALRQLVYALAGMREQPGL
jgi:hypothetical protein